MQRLAGLVGQFTIAAAVKYMSMKEYGAAGCAEESMKKDMVVAQESLLKMMGLSGIPSCKNISEDSLMSQNYVCKSGYLEVETFLNDKCSGTPPSSTSMKCMKDDNNKWMSFACDADVTGYFTFQYSKYKSKDCSGDPETGSMARQLDKCVVDAKQEDDGNWTDGSYKATKSGNVLTTEEFSTGDCSGSLKKKDEITCDACSSDGVKIGCGGVAVAAGATQPCCILPVMLLLAFGAKTR